MATPNDSTPEVRTRDFEQPVRWLLGRQLISGLKDIVLYSLYGEKFTLCDWMQAKTIDHSDDAQHGEFWFDFLADTGDGQQAVYNIAYLCQADLWVAKDASPGEGKVSTGKNDEFTTKLPRGQLLFIGGDAGYHIADYSTLAQRFQTPFNWAYQDHVDNGAQPAPDVPIYAIPANHDYYDVLDGFNRQFRRPAIGASDDHAAQENGPNAPQLHLNGFKREQEASFLAIQLPYNWWFFGFDSQEGKMDKRQAHYFRQVLREHDPKKLIVATPEPSTVFGKFADEDAAIVKTFAGLDLPQAFLKNSNGVLSPDRCRLDLSGDIHHYARHWGVSVAGSDAAPRANYASVVAGGGGAFLHPSQTTAGELVPNRLYPEPEDSHRTITPSLLSSWRIATGGAVPIAGGIIAVIVYFALTISDSSRQFLMATLGSQCRWISDLLNNIGMEHFKPEGWFDQQLYRIGYALTSGNAMPVEVTPYCSKLGWAVLLLGLSGFWVYYLQAHAKSIAELSHEAWIKFNRALAASTLFAVLIVGHEFFFTSDKLGLPSFVQSTLVLIYLSISVATMILLRSLSDLFLARRKHLYLTHDTTKDPVDKRLELAWLGFIFCAAWVSGLGGIWRFGQEYAAILLSDMLAILVLVGLPLGLIGLAWAGAKLLPTGKRLAFMLVVGVWHTLLQLATPLVLAIYVSGIQAILVLALLAGVSVWLGRLIRGPASSDGTNARILSGYDQSTGWVLLGAWMLVGAAMLYATVSFGTPHAVTPARLLIALISGAALSCLWFGWYLAVSISFHAHNNEAGGGARCDRYRHFIRFKLEKDKLTGYVIGVDNLVADFRPDQGGEGIKPFRLVDVFQVSASG